MNYRVGNELKKALIGKDFIKEEVVITTRARLKLLTLTEKGRGKLNELGLFLKNCTGGGAEHEYWKSKVKEKLQDNGYKMKEEVPVFD